MTAAPVGDGASGPRVEFCGEIHRVADVPFTIGRDADLVLDDDNRFLHRHFLSLTRQRGVWLLDNVGTQLTATVSDVDGRLEAFLAPGGALPLVFDRTVVRCTAGPTTYELSILLDDPAFRVGRRLDDQSVGEPGVADDPNDATVGRVELTPEQFLMLVALAEGVLRGDGRAAASLPSSAAAARRLGWTTTKFSRKLDNVCAKLTAHGVRGLHGAAGRLATNRRARLVEYALAVRLVTRADLNLLDTIVDDPQ